MVDETRLTDSVESGVHSNNYRRIFGSRVEPRQPPPSWLTIGTFVVAVILICSGVVLTIFRGSLSTGSFALAVLGFTLLTFLYQRTPSSAVDKYADQIRDRVNEEATNYRFNVQSGGVVHVETSLQDAATVRASNSLEKQEAILREIYTQGLAQAKVSFRVSLFFAGVGAALLLGGVGLAIFHAESTGERYASIVSGVAGVVINLTSGVFFVQSNRARKNMGQQGVMLREESQEDRRLNAARELAGAISDEKLRDQVRADLALKLLKADNADLSEGQGAKAEKSGSRQTDPQA